jgi:putative CocE/NonD family hydrolase
MAQVNRGWKSYFLDRAVGWWIGLPWESSNFTIEKVRIPIADDMHLVANVYRTSLSKPRATILVRTSYGIGPGLESLQVRFYAARGYNVLHVACRGTDPTDGCELVPGKYEGVDGQATVAWMREQTWYTGSFAMVGSSYVGYTQWAIMANPPLDMKAAVASTAMADLSEFTWGDVGALESHMICWADLMTATRRGLKPGLDLVKAQPENLKPIYDGAPMVEAAQKYFVTHFPYWLHGFMTDPESKSELCKSVNYSEALSRAEIPILQTTGWDDSMMQIVTNQHSIMVEKGKPVSLTIGPWSHMGSGRSNIKEEFVFIERHLANRHGAKSREATIRAYITGVNEWRDYTEWPPSGSAVKELYLGPGNRLLSEKSDGEAGHSRFTFNPQEPTPSIGLPRPFDGVNPNTYEDTTLATRSDVLTFTTAPLQHDLEVIGRPTITLHHTSDNPNVDILIRVSEVKPNGKSRRITDVYKRLDPNRGGEPLKLELADCGHRFRKGMRVRVVIAGGAHPARIRNLGTGENPGTGREMREAVHTVHHSGVRVSKLSLPVFA